jgi:cold-inducible RNA-binding protein
MIRLGFLWTEKRKLWPFSWNAVTLKESLSAFVFTSEFLPAATFLSVQLVSEHSDKDLSAILKGFNTVTNIFVGNLSYQVTQEDLQAAFEAYGAVERVNIVTDRATGQPRGFAFVEMTDSQAAQTAISQLNGAELRGRAMNVNEARPKPAGGGYGDGRGQGGGGNRGGGRSRW